MTTEPLSLPRPRGFALRAASEFYAGFTPGSGMATVDGAGREPSLTLAFRLDGTYEAVAVCLREEGDRVILEPAGTTDHRALRAQVARMLGLDQDPDAWLAVGARDPVVGRLQAEFPGFFTAAKPSPYDAACWGVLAARLPMTQAATLKTRLAEQRGDVVRLHGRAHAVFPSPAQLEALDAFPGLPEQKLARLRGVGAAARAGKLDAERLRAADVATALSELQELPGVGPWTASHILFRGAALPDGLPTAEPRVLHGLAAAYGLDAPTDETLATLGVRWRPFRMWVCVLLARHLARAEGGRGWRHPGLARERAAAGRKLRRT
ncbi:MAG: DNA-3-methyladenine glycosylase 2 family protein [Myxococcales bacterium]|nr:DNA-3-methyladenine glycosylase 2 family protein [Myxococcales bacterium]HQY61422.1 hypothetical protein [Polyangiaceae bacterium]